MKYIRNNKNKKGFTLIELIVVMSIIGILALLAAPVFIGKTEEATRTKHFATVRILEDAAERYFIDHGKWPRGEEEPYTPEEVSAYAERIFDITGEEVVLEEGHYWNIDYEALRPYAKLPSEDDRANYVLRNPVGKIYYLDGLTDEGASRITKEVTPAEEAVPVPVPETEPEPAIPRYYTVATDADFTKVLDTGAPNKSYYWRYTGSDEFIIIPETINGEAVTGYYRMFDSLSSVTVKGVASENLNVTNMSYMFYQSPSTSLDLSHLDTSSVTTMMDMFANSKATSLDVSSFNTAKVTNMSDMFRSSVATVLDLSSFDTSKVTNMYFMFASSQATTLDVSSFNTANVTSMGSMFRSSWATKLDLSSFNTWNVTGVDYMFQGAAATTGYARNATDAAKLNGSSYRSGGLTFIVKGQPIQYVLATDADFVGTASGSFRYNGVSQYVIIPDTIKGVTVTSYKSLFQSSGVKGVVSDNPRVTDMSNMFYQSLSTSLDVSHLDTSNVTNMSYMFFDSRATVLDLRSFDTAKVTNMSDMFSSSEATTIDMSTFDTSNVTNMNSMFQSSNATTLDVHSFNTAKVTAMGYMFRSSRATKLDLSSFDTWNASGVDSMFNGASATTGYARNATDAAKFNSGTYRPSGLTFIVKGQPVQYVLATDVDFVGTANGSFRYNGVSQYVIMPDTIKGVSITSYKYLFQNSGVRGVVSTNPRVTDMSYMFYQSLSTSLDVSHLDTSNVTNMSYMFFDSRPTVLDLRSFDTAKVTNMSDMFSSSEATTIDMSTFDTSNVTNMSSMFQSSNATTLDVSSFNTAKVTDMGYMFRNTAARTGYARNATDAAKLNSSTTYRPSGLTFIVK